MENFSNNTGDDDDIHRGERVELATLTLPMAAIEGGIVSGVGTEVALESTSEVVQQIIESTATAVEESSFEHQAPVIQAVVDLEKLSELVGIQEDEFVEGLHRGAIEQYDDDNVQVDPPTKSEMIENGDNQENTAPVNQTTMETVPEESTPLLPTHRRRVTADSAMLLPPLTIPPRNRHRRQVTADSVVLPADPFVESLATVLQSINTTTVSAAVTPATLEENQYLAHDAFLLEVPSSHAKGGDEEHKFVLALPEIQTKQQQPPPPPPGCMSNEYPFLERMLSLPTDVKEANLEATAVPTTKKDSTTAELKLDLVVERQVPIIGYVILITALFSLATLGAALDSQGGNVTSLMKAYWRVTATAIVLFPLALRSILCNGFPQLSKSQLMLFPLSAVCYAIGTSSFVTSLSMTSMANAFVLSNLPSLIIIAGKFVLRIPILCLEGAGVIVGLVGVAICAGTTSGGGGDEQEVYNGQSNREFWGNMIAFLASFGFAGYFVIAKNIRSSVDLFVFMFSIMLQSSFFVLAFMLLRGETVMFSRDRDYGIFGWTNLSWDRLPLEMYVAIVCNVFGVSGYIAVLKYFEAVVTSTVMLMEPVCAALIGAALGIERLPGAQVWIGDGIVSIGCFLVILSGARKTESIDATEALRTKINTTESSCDYIAPVVTDDSKKENGIPPPQIGSPVLLKSPISRNRKTPTNGSRKKAKVVWG